MLEPERRVLINCPTIDYEPVDTGKRARSVEGFHNELVSCPNCGEEHVWGAPQAWLDES